MDSLTHLLSKNVYNDVFFINGSKITALNVFYHSTFASLLTRRLFVRPLFTKTNLLTIKGLVEMKTAIFSKIGDANIGQSLGTVLEHKQSRPFITLTLCGNALTYWSTASCL